MDHDFFETNSKRKTIALNTPENKIPPTLPHEIEYLYRKDGLVRFLKEHKLMFSKALGQNFLHNRNMMKAILKAMEIPKGSVVLEIGPGLGHLTWTMIEQGYHVIALEKDRTFIKAIEDLSRHVDPQHEWHTIIEQDAAEADYAALKAEHDIHTVIGNLPYYAIVPILFNVAYAPVDFDSLGFMVQKEVGERIMAETGNKNYGRLAIVLNYLFKVRPVKSVPPKAFIPMPNVDSLFMKFMPKPDVDKVFAEKYLERVVKVGFMHRRKKLRGQFKGMRVEQLHVDDETLALLDNEFNLDERAQDWDLPQWVKFAQRIRDLQPETV